MRVLKLTDIGRAEAGTPKSSPSDAMKVLYYLKRRANEAASDDMIITSVFNGEKSKANSAISKCLGAKAIENISGG